MPWSALKHCPAGHPPYRGKHCPVCTKARRDRYEKQRPSARQRGYSTEWQKAAKAFLAEPGNELCACGCGQPAEVVDHIVPHKGNRALMWNRSNWQPMTRACNSRKAAAQEGAFGRNPRRQPREGASPILDRP